VADRFGATGRFVHIPRRSPLETIPLNWRTAKPCREQATKSDLAGGSADDGADERRLVSFARRIH